MNKLYYEQAIREAYEQGKIEGELQAKLAYGKVIFFLKEHKDKNNYISKKIRKLLEELNQ